jgi:hypothetical protein
MDSLMAIVGFAAIGAICLAIVVLAVVSWVKNRHGEIRKRDEDGGGADLFTEGPTPGSWE